MRSLLVFFALCISVHAQTFRTSVDQVVVPLTVHSDVGEPAADLLPEDFRVFDDGEEVTVAMFGRFPKSVHLLLLIDTSRSAANALADARAAADAAIAQLAPDDSIRIGTFSDTLRLSPPFGGDDRQLAARLRLTPGANMTVLYDALVEGCDVFSGEMERRVILAITDGTDTASSASAPIVVRRAAEAGVAIYIVGLTSRYVERGKPIVRAPDPSLREIAEATGGRYIDAGARTDFTRLLAGIIQELHEQHMLAFTPVRADGRVHLLTVTARRPNITVRARKQYLAPLP